MKPVISSFLVFFIILTSQNATAQTQTDSSFTQKLDEVVVTGQFKPQSLQKSVYQVRIINQALLHQLGATNIQQVLSTQAGFRFSNDNALSISDVQLNGMGGNNVKILVDGIPMIDRYDERVSLSQIDINIVDRIEIVEGPMSVSYGTDAMAGVINIITKKPEKNSLGVVASAQEEMAGNEYYPFSYRGVHNQNATINYSKNKLLTSVGFTHNDFDGHGGDTYGRGKKWKPKEQWMGTASIGYLLGNGGRVVYKIDGLHEDINVRNPINMNNYKAIDQKFKTNRYLHQLQGNYRLGSNISLDGFLAYSHYTRETETLHRNFELQTVESGIAGDNDFSKLNDIAFKSTVNWEITPKVSLQPGVDINHEKASGDRIEGQPSIDNYAFFMSAEIKPTDALKIRPGFRSNINSEYHAPIAIPSLNTKIRLSDQADLRLAYGYGFRAPTLRELYLKFFDINHDLIGNTDLKAETSNNINGSVTYSIARSDATDLYLVLSGYYSTYHNQIDLVESRTSTTAYTYYNIDRSKVSGGRLEGHLRTGKFNINTGFSLSGYSSSLFDDPDYVKDDNRNTLWTPEATTDILYNIRFLNSGIGLFYKFYGSKPAFSFGKIDDQDAIIHTRTGAYHLADLTIRSKITQTIETRLGIKNIFNVKDVSNTTVTTSGSGLPVGGARSVGYGRSAFLGVIFKWNKKQ